MRSTEELIANIGAESKVGRKMTPLALFARWFVGSVLVVIITLCCLGLRPDLSAKLMDPLYTAELAILFCMTLCMAFTAACLSFPDMHQKHWALYLPPASVGAFFVTLGLAYNESAPTALPVHGIECLLCILLISLMPAVWMFILLKKQASTHLKMAGATAVLAAMSIGALALRLSEQTDSLPHLITWHYLPMLVVAMLGSWLGQRVLRW